MLQPSVVLMRHGFMRQDSTRAERDRAHIDRNLERFRGNVQADRRYHGGNWSAPHGYSYRHWSYGQRLPSDYFARNFWIMSFASYGLMPPPPDAVWVRYGPDALLVDRDTGEIIRVQYGVFY